MASKWVLFLFVQLRVDESPRMGFDYASTARMDAERSERWALAASVAIIKLLYGIVV